MAYAFPDKHALPNIGAGIGARTPIMSALLSEETGLGFVEITAEHYMGASKAKLRELDMLCEKYTVIPHAVGLSLGSAEGLDKKYLSALSALIKRVSPPWWSEHIAFTKAGGLEVGHLSPLPYNSDSIKIMKKNTSRANAEIPYPLILENITYLLEVPGKEMEEPQFLTEVSLECNCGLLLDVTNTFINAQNHGFSFSGFLKGLPAEKTVQFHVSGGYIHANGLWIDSHSQPVPEKIWQAVSEAFKILQPKACMIERDTEIPPYRELRPEIDRAKGIFL